MANLVTDQADKPLGLRYSLAGWNGQARCNRSSPEAFLDSYIRRFPDRDKWIMDNLEEAWRIVEGFIKSKPVLLHPTRTPTPKPKARKDPELLPTNEWVPRERYIPDHPNSRYTYRQEATRIARHMREQLEKLEE